MLQKLKQGLWDKVGFIGLSMSPLMAHAAIDVSAIEDVAADVAIVGAAIFAVLVAIKAWKLYNRTL
ncbi:MAG: major capsid protein [Candidatus Accumulibacter sp.]|nr:major capsid protein [Accumulibacter sp.]